MRSKKYSCPNGCNLPPRKKVLQENHDGTYGFAYSDFTFCPCCGALMPETLRKLKGFFDIYHIHPDLERVKSLLYKSEFEAAAREAFVAVETALRKKSGLEAHGVDLATRALAFEYDKKAGELKKRPLIALNTLKSDSERNEQEGVRYMIMGFFQGPRNIFQHNHVGSGVADVISIVVQASFFLDLLNGHTITKNGHWIPNRIAYIDIYKNMPRRSDRFRLFLNLRRRAHHLKKINRSTQRINK